MSLSRQDRVLNKRERVNQKARTRAALVAAAAALLAQGRPPSVPDAAAAALVSTATAYRYFASAEELWAEAALQALDLNSWLDEVDLEIDKAGDDIAARATVAARTVGGRMLADQRPFRQLLKNSFERWFAQQDQLPAEERAPLRAGRRDRTNRTIVEPLRGVLDDDQRERLVRALALVSGIDAIVVLTDALALDPDEALATLIDANRWLIAGALADLGVPIRNVSPAADEREDAGQRFVSRSCDGSDGSMPL
jgi:AcrR family transcriptional regulator